MSSIGWYRSDGPNSAGQVATACLGLAGGQDLGEERAFVSLSVDSSDSLLVLADLSLEAGEDPAVFMNDDV